MLPLPNPRSPKPSTIVQFVPSNTFMALSRQFYLHFELKFGRLLIVSESLSVHIQVVQFCAETNQSPAALPPSAYNFRLTFGFCRSLISGIIPIPYIAIAKGSPSVVPSVEIKTVLLTYKLRDVYMSWMM